MCLGVGVMQPYEQLEEQFGNWCGNPNTVSCASGSAALHLALETLDISPHTSVIVPEFTMISCARAVTLSNLSPLFVDCQDDLLLDVTKIPTHNNISAIMPVHIYGRQCDMEAVHTYAEKRNALVVEDMAEIHGVQPHPKTHAACWSFYKNKIIAGEEGGMVTFRNPEHVIRAKQLRSCGFTDKHNFLHLPGGMNYRMSNAHASLILNSLRNVDDNLKKRRQVAEWYTEFLPKKWRMPFRKSCWVYDLRIPGCTEPKQNQIIEELNARGIPARHSFKPMSRQPEYRGSYEHLNAHGLSNEVLYLPLCPEYNRDTIRRFVSVLLSIV